MFTISGQQRGARGLGASAGEGNAASAEATHGKTSTPIGLMKLPLD
jgi:hypothetical protein